MTVDFSDYFWVSVSLSGGDQGKISSQVIFFLGRRSEIDGNRGALPKCQIRSC